MWRHQGSMNSVIELIKMRSFRAMCHIHINVDQTIKPSFFSITTWLILLLVLVTLLHRSRSKLATYLMTWREGRRVPSPPHPRNTLWHVRLGRGAFYCLPPQPERRQRAATVSVVRPRRQLSVSRCRSECALCTMKGSSHPHCADPFKRHKTHVRKGLRNASKVLADRINDPRITKDTPLCSNCRIKLTKDPNSLPEPSPEETPTITSTEGSGTGSEHHTSMEDDDVQAVLDRLKQTPVKKSKCQSADSGLFRLISIVFGIFFYVATCFIPGEKHTFTYFFPSTFQ